MTNQPCAEPAVSRTSVDETSLRGVRSANLPYRASGGLAGASRKKVTLLRDYREDGRTSMERYADQLATSLAARECANYELMEFRPRLGAVSRRLPQLANLRMRYARYRDYPRQASNIDSDIYHITDHGYAHLLPRLEPDKTIITVHDMIPLLAGRGLIPGVSLRRNWLAEYSSSHLKRAARIITDSENSKRDIVRHCGCDFDSVEVVYPGLVDTFRPLGETRGRLRKLLGLPDEAVKLVLISGGQFYKNHAASLAVLRLLQGKYGSRVALVRLGRDGPEWRRLLQRSAYRGDVMLLNELSEEQLVALYNAVDCLLFPSWYEGFGWPPLEAMACGTPVVTSNRASLPEVIGDVGPTFEADDVEGMAGAVETLLYDARYRAAQIQRGWDQAARFSWENTSGQVLRAYASLS